MSHPEQSDTIFAIKNVLDNKYFIYKFYVVQVKLCLYYKNKNNTNEYRLLLSQNMLNDC